MSCTFERGFSCVNMVVGIKGFLSLIVLLVILSSSWFVAVLLDYYTGHGEPLTSHRNTNLAPFPSDKMENIFWFVQVRRSYVSLSLTYMCSHHVMRIISGPVFKSSKISKP